MEDRIEQTLYKKLTEYYNAKQSFRERNALRVLAVGNGTCFSYCIEKFQFLYELIDISEDKVYILKKIWDFKPDIIWMYDSVAYVKTIFNHRNILYITVNDYSTYLYLIKDRVFGRNEVGLFFQRNNIIKQICGEQNSRHIIHIEYLEDSNFLDSNIEIAEEFRTDIMVVGASNSSLTSCRKFVKALIASWMAGIDSVKEKFYNALDILIDELCHKMDKTGQLIENVDEYADMFDTIIQKNNIELDFMKEISKEDLQYFYFMLRAAVGYPIFRFLIVKWIVEHGYNIELWGDAWKDEDVVKKCYAGTIKIDEREKLKQTYNGAKICLFTNPDLSFHFSVFEMIGSKSLCLAYENERVSCSTLLSEYFEDGRSIALFHNRNELFEKIDHYLNDTQHREAVIQEGNKKIIGDNMCWENELSKAVFHAVSRAEDNGMFESL